MNQSILDSEKLHLAELLEAIQRCVYFLDASSRKLTWPLTKERLETLGIEPKQADFSSEFMLIVKTNQVDESGVAK